MFLFVALKKNKLIKMKTAKNTILLRRNVIEPVKMPLQDFNSQQQKVVTQEVTEVYQPLGRTKYLKTSADIDSSKAYVLIMGNLGTIGIDKTNKVNCKNEKLIQEQTRAPHIINRLKLQVDDALAFTNNPILKYRNADGQLKDVEIDIQKYLNEYQFKTKVLTIPVRFVMDSRFMALTWDLLPLADDDGVTKNVTVTAYVEKVIGQVTSI